MVIGARENLSSNCSLFFSILKYNYTRNVKKPKIYKINIKCMWEWVSKDVKQKTWFQLRWALHNIWRILPNDSQIMYASNASNNRNISHTTQKSQIIPMNYNWINLFINILRNDCFCVVQTIWLFVMARSFGGCRCCCCSSFGLMDVHLLLNFIICSVVYSWVYCSISLAIF